MDCAATPIQLHVGLKYVCRVHGLTPHRSTGRCPYEMVKEGPLPSLFPMITSGNNVKSESTAVNNSAARQRNRRLFHENEDVVVYCNRFKTSSAGKILEVLGNNNYMVDCGKGPQHVSGDCITRVPNVATRAVGAIDHGTQQASGGEVAVQNDVMQYDMLDDQAEDARSIISESSIDSDIVAAPMRHGRDGRDGRDGRVRGVQGRRRRRVADQLGPVQWNLQRLRPRN